MRSVKPWLYLFSTGDPHSLVNGTHSQVGTANALVRPSPRSYAKQPSSVKVAIIFKYLLTENSLARRQTLIQVDGG